MEWIIIIIIGIIIFSFLGGGDFPFPLNDHLMEAKYQLKADQWYCSETVWETEPKMVNGHFEGTQSIDCIFEGLSGGGVRELRKHMEDALPKSASAIHEGPMIENFEGLPSLAYDLTLDMETEKENVSIRGKTHIATNGFTKLHNTFISTKVPTRGNAKYLKKIRTDIDVEATEWKGWYNFKFSNFTRVEKPWFVNSETFVNTIVEKSEEEFEARAQDVLNNIANNI